jgi:RNA polymerase sigma-70 factor, ECF subfamily
MENTLASARVMQPVRSDAADEQSWLEAARAGEPWALEQFYRSYVAPIHALCARMLGRTHDTEDAVQATFIQAFRALQKFRGDSTIRTWVYRIAVNQCVTMLRKRREAGPVPEELASTDDSAVVVMRESVWAALGQIPADQRALLVLRYWEQMDCDEIASVLSISTSAVKMRLHRARLEFRKRYEGDLS